MVQHLVLTSRARRPLGVAAERAITDAPHADGLGRSRMSSHNSELSQREEPMFLKRLGHVVCDTVAPRIFAR